MSLSSWAISFFLASSFRLVRIRVLRLSLRLLVFASSCFQLLVDKGDFLLYLFFPLFLPTDILCKDRNGGEDKQYYGCKTFHFFFICSRLSFIFTLRPMSGSSLSAFPQYRKARLYSFSANRVSA